MLITYPNKRLRNLVDRFLLELQMFTNMQASNLNLLRQVRDWQRAAICRVL